MYKEAYANTVNRQLAQLARPFYPEDGPNSWQHIQEVRRRAQKMNRMLEQRGLNPAELAAVLFHDSTKDEFGKENHGRMGAERAAKILAASMLSKEQIDEAAQAIAVHDDNLKEFPSRTAELLASADANPPDIDWFLNKSWCHNIHKGHTPEESYAYIVNGPMKPNYGTDGRFNWPGVYKDYYGDKVPEYQRQIDGMTEDEARDRLSAYHAKYGIDPENPHVIHNR